MTRSVQVAPPVWDAERLEKDREKAIQTFRDERIKEPLERYLEQFEVCRDAFDELLETTVDLTRLSEHASEVLKTKPWVEALRYLSSPPVSVDDLKVIAEADSISPKALRAAPALAARIVETALSGLDRRRFPWLSEGREASEHERATAVIASAAMLAMRRVETHRRNQGKDAQEKAVQAVLKGHDFREVDRRTVSTHSDAPKPGEFCMESMLGSEKADLLVGLWDRRLLPIECKVSNSATNSIKRLNKDAAHKAVEWRRLFGEMQVVPSAVLSGVYKLRKLEEAQERGLTLFWAHSLDELLAFVDRTRAP